MSRGAVAFRALRHRDFRLLWAGGFISFAGSQMQNVALGYYVFDVTGSSQQLSWVMGAFTLPVFFLAPIAGAVSDLMDRRWAMVFALLVNALGAVALAGLYFTDMLQIWHILAISMLAGIVQTIEAPARQSVIRTVVGDEDLPSAVPLQAMTFNAARIAGPALGGVLVSLVGVGACFVINVFSFFGLIGAVLGIRADLKPVKGEISSIRSLLFEGVVYTFRDANLRILFLMESATSIFGVFYISQMAAIAKEKLGLGAQGLGWAQACVGAGALVGLLSLSMMAHKPYKTRLIRIAMTSCAAGLILLSQTTTPWLAFPLFFVLGASTIMQFNSTNVLIQLMSPDRLRGRVLAMHLWAIAGLAPFGVFTFGWVAEEFSLSAALLVGGSILLACSALGWRYGGRVAEKAAGAA